MARVAAAGKAHARAKTPVSAPLQKCLQHPWRAGYYRPDNLLTKLLINTFILYFYRYAAWNGIGVQFEYEEWGQALISGEIPELASGHGIFMTKDDTLSYAARDVPQYSKRRVSVYRQHRSSAPP